MQTPGEGVRQLVHEALVDIRADDHILLVRGAVPGPASGMVAIKKPKIIKKK